MLERVKYEKQVNWQGRHNFQGELLEEYPLADYVKISDTFIKEERIHPTEVTDNAKELGRRWAVMAPEVKQRFQTMAEQARQKYDQEMAAYRQANPAQPIATQVANANQQNTNQQPGGSNPVAGASTSKLPGSAPTTVPGQPGGAGYAALSGSDYSSFLLQ